MVDEYDVGFIHRKRAAARREDVKRVGIAGGKKYGMVPPIKNLS